MASCHCGLPLQHDLMELSVRRSNNSLSSHEQQHRTHTHSRAQTKNTMETECQKLFSLPRKTLTEIEKRKQICPRGFLRELRQAGMNTVALRAHSEKSTVRKTHITSRPPYQERRWVPGMRSLHQAAQVLSKRVAGDLTKQSPTVISIEVAECGSTQTNVMNGSQSI